MGQLSRKDSLADDSDSNLARNIDSLRTLPTHANNRTARSGDVVQQIWEKWFVGLGKKISHCLLETRTKFVDVKSFSSASFGFFLM